MLSRGLSMSSFSVSYPISSIPPIDIDPWESISTFENDLSLNSSSKTSGTRENARRRNLSSWKLFNLDWTGAWLYLSLASICSTYPFKNSWFSSLSSVLLSVMIFSSCRFGFGYIIGSETFFSSFKNGFAFISYSDGLCKLLIDLYWCIMMPESYCIRLLFSFVKLFALRISLVFF